MATIILNPLIFSLALLGSPASGRMVKDRVRVEGRQQ